MASSNIDIQGLINQILGMVQNQSSSSKSGNSSWDDSPAGLAYWADKRKRNTELEAGKQKEASEGNIWDKRISGELTKTELTNKGNLDVENAKTKGLLDVAGAKENWAKNDPFSAAMERVAGNRELLTSDEGVERARQFGLMVKDPNIKPTPISPPPPFKDTRGFFGRMFNTTPDNAGTVPTTATPPPTGSDKGTFYKDTIPSPSVNPSAVQARQSLTGGQSMEFREPGTMSLEDQEKRRKESNRRMFPGTKFE